MSGSIVQSVPVVFQPNASVSDPVNLAMHITSLSVPSGWGANVMSFDGGFAQAGPWWSLIDEATGAEITRAVAELKGMPISPISIHGYPWFRLRRGTAASPVAWTAGGTVLLGGRPYA